MLWEGLDEVVSRLKADGEGAEPSDKGEAFGRASCIAIMTNPYNPDIDAVRAEAMRRYEDRNVQP